MRLPPPALPPNTWLAFEQVATGPDHRGDWRWALTRDGRWYQSRGEAEPLGDDPQRRFGVDQVEAIAAAADRVPFAGGLGDEVSEDDGAAVQRWTLVEEDGATQSVVVPYDDVPEPLRRLGSAVDEAVAAPS